MLAQFSIVPIGAGSSISDQVAAALRIVDESGLPYRVNPMGTVLEGEWDEVMGLIRRCRDELMKNQERVLISVSIDDRKGRPNRIEEKVASVERRIGKPLSR